MDWDMGMLLLVTFFSGLNLGCAIYDEKSRGISIIAFVFCMVAMGLRLATMYWL